MKILIGYDGSVCSAAALDDLRAAGLPETDVEAHIISIAEVWLPPADSGDASDEDVDKYVERIVEKHRAKAQHEVDESEKLAAQGAQRVAQMFPDWKVESEGTFGSPAWVIISRSNDLKSDLIVVGSHGHTALGRMFLGSISQKVITEAHCSVRVARGRVQVDSSPSRILVGFDDTQGAQAAVNAVLARNWNAKSEVRLVTVTDVVTPTAIGVFIPPVVKWADEETIAERDWLEQLAAASLKKLNENGLAATLQIKTGNPKRVLVEEAEEWQADSIFVGANRYGSRVERFLLGSVSAAVAARAHCSVEIVRNK